MIRPRSFTAQNVDVVRHRLNVTRANAQLHAAKMVEIMTRWDGSVLQRKAVTVRANSPSVDVEQAVAVLATATTPKPTRLGFLDVRPIVNFCRRLVTGATNACSWRFAMGATDSLKMHREASLSGVTGRVVSATAPLHSTIWGRVEAPATYRAPQFTRGDSADGWWTLFGCW